MSKSVVVVSLISLVILAVPAWATVIHVPGDQPSIQGGIYAAANGDTVLVAPGTYYENINFRGRNIVLAGHFILSGDTDVIETTIIDGSQPTDPDTASTVLFFSGEDSTAILEGFTVTGGTGTVLWDAHESIWYRDGGGILIHRSSPTIRNNRIVYNEAVDLSGVVNAGGGGIRCGDGDPTIEGNVIQHNQGAYAAGVMMHFSTGRIRRNIIADNHGGWGWGGGGFEKYSGGTTLFEYNTIVGNSSTGQGALPIGKGGAMVIWAGPIVCRNNIIWGNTQESGAQIYHFGSEIADIRYCDIEDGWDGVGIIDLDPLFADDEYTLSENSPCIDSGDPQSPLDPDGTRTDMGAKLYYHFDAPYIWLTGYSIDDSVGDTDIIESEDTVNVVIALLNTSLDATGVTASFTSSDPEVLVLQDTAAFGDMDQNGSASNEGSPFTFTVGQDAVAHRAAFDLLVSADEGYEIAYSLYFVVGTPNILLVDDDQGTSLEQVYTEALETKDLFPAVWEVSSKGSPTLEAIGQHTTIIWFTGDDRQTSLTSEEQAVITEYLDGGGKLLLAGSNIGYDLVESGSAQDAAFFADYLHADYISDSITESFLYGVADDPITGQFAFFVLNANQTSPDVIAPLGGSSTTMIYYSTQQAAAVKYANGYRIVYFALGFEGIDLMGAGSNQKMRGILLDNAIRWLTYVPVESDVNQDGQINILDVLATVNIILGNLDPIPSQEWAADCNADGIVNVLDVIGIVNVVLGIGTCPPLCAIQPAPETVAYLRALESYLAPTDFAALMNLVGEVQTPSDFALSQNYPNPFNPTTTIHYTLPGKGSTENGERPFLHTTLKIYNILGQQVRTLVDEVQEAGYYTVGWDGTDERGRAVSSGVYFYRFTAGEYREIRKMLLLK